MISIAEFLGILVIAILFSSLFFYGFGRTGPWGTFWSFILIVFLGIFLFDIWIDPLGPLWWGVAWIDLLIVGLIIALLLAAASPTSRPGQEPLPADTETSGSAVIAMGVFFWILLIVFIVVGIVGLWR